MVIDDFDNNYAYNYNDKCADNFFINIMRILIFLFILKKKERKENKYEIFFIFFILM